MSSAVSVASAELPIEPVLPELRRALGAAGSAVLQAPPGAGKTTRVPLALLDEPWLGGEHRRVVMLEPRRLAARAAAMRMAAARREGVGETVGYRMRLDSRVGPRTRIEVVTEGVLIRMLHDDMALDGVGLVIFDEFHERSLDADLGLALCLEVQRSLREDLKLLVMSATLDGAAVARLLGDAPIVTSEGRSYPVETRYRERPAGEPVETGVAAIVRDALDAGPDGGDVLAFLPGGREIRRAARLIGDAGLPPAVDVHPLYGDLPPAMQDAALRPAPPGRRKIVLATTIAETSLTIEGVRVVVDGGYARAPRFDPRTGMTRLETVRVSQAASDQRRGRAGRTAPGVCYRLWSEAGQRALVPQSRPEILDADLAPLALDLAAWGADPAALPWLDRPPEGAYAQAADLLIRLGALDPDGRRLTPRGRRMVALGIHPRLAAMLVRAREEGQGAAVLACDIAALFGERDVVSGDGDLRSRLALLRGGGSGRGGAAAEGAVRRIRQGAVALRRRLGLAAARAEDGDAVAVPPLGEAGRLLAYAYADRIAQRRADMPGEFRLSNGSGAWLPTTDPLAAADFLVAADLDGDRRRARIFLAAPVDRAAIEEAFADAIVAEDVVRWDRRDGAVAARRQRRLGALVLDDAPLPAPPPARVVPAMLDGIRDLGLAALPWTPEIENWRARVAFLRRVEGEEEAGWPDLSDAALLASLEAWLAPFLDGVTRRAHLARVDLGAALRAQLDWARQQRLDTLAPTHAAVPSGRRIPLDYTTGETPVLAVKLQEMFGAMATPSIAGGRVPLVVHLLSPAGRPIQVTQDLAGFWASSYRAVRAEMRGRYPKHDWPEDPLRAVPTHRAKPRS
ncbi:MAG TPA: ATP-dependent helicase HrpB [Stellaceae bacterium]|jgi:ATP-dependent helicase HrpB